MTEKEKQNTLRWIQAWERAGPELERLRHKGAFMIELIKLGSEIQ